ncbi:hypothetical protein NXG27_06075 [Megasphaera paucivorans]|uniref:Uncharacterized protein n=1 Tax=Megasphaera paucivorans TaxID=349095 RepID=A0A1H0AE92_9FIRM|nr:hypothetical protein [Megasphaera paucivorans]SDN31066.1 hypothetical protein SAMN05660299_02497 [Megasphaera paucivorans]
MSHYERITILKATQKNAEDFINILSNTEEKSNLALQSLQHRRFLSDDDAIDIYNVGKPFFKEAYEQFEKNLMISLVNQWSYVKI